MQRILTPEHIALGEKENAYVVGANVELTDRKSVV